MEQTSARAAINSLPEEWRAKYRHSNFQDEKYACIELTLAKETANTLENELNSRLTLQAGFRANLRFKELRKNGDLPVYIAEIVPFPYVPRHQWEDATEDVLKSLPRIIEKHLLMQKKK